MSQIKLTMLLVVLLQLLGLQLTVLAATTPATTLTPPPANYIMKYNLEGKGFQKYMCKKNSTHQLSWQLYGVSAKLTTLDTHQLEIGNHFLIHEQRNGLKPVWEIQGQRIFGKKVGAVPPTNVGSIPWLKLEASGGSGIKLVYRKSTIGGLATGECPHEKRTTNIGYTARYTFYGPPSS